MKKIVSVVMVLCMTLALTACGKEQSASYRMETEQGGIAMTDTMALDAKGDKIHTITETITMDLSSLDEATQEERFASCDELVAQYSAVEGVTAEGSSDAGVYTLVVTIDATGNAVTDLAEANLLQIQGDGSKLSLKATGEALEAGGYSKVEE